MFDRQRLRPGGHPLDHLRTSPGGLRLRATARDLAPLNADGGVFDPNDSSFALVNISSTITTDFKLQGCDCEQRQDHLSPYTADGVGVTRPTTAALVDINSSLRTSNSRGCDCEQRQGHLYAYTAWRGCVDPTDNSPWWTSARPSLPTTNSWGLRLRATARSSLRLMARTLWESSSSASPCDASPLDQRRPATAPAHWRADPRANRRVMKDILSPVRARASRAP